MRTIVEIVEGLMDGMDTKLSIASTCPLFIEILKSELAINCKNASIYYYNTRSSTMAKLVHKFANEHQEGILEYDLKSIPKDEWFVINDRSELGSQVIDTFKFVKLIGTKQQKGSTIILRDTLEIYLDIPSRVREISFKRNDLNLYLHGPNRTTICKISKEAQQMCDEIWQKMYEDIK